MPSRLPPKLSSLRKAASELKKHVERADQNSDQQLSPEEVQAYAQGRDEPRSRQAVEQALTVVHGWARPVEKGSSHRAVANVQRRVDQALGIVERQDQNHNGRIDAGQELKSAKRLKSFQALDALVEAGKPPTTAQLKEAIEAWAPEAVYVSEGDYTPKFFSVPFESKPGSGEPQRMIDALGPELATFYENGEDLSGYTFDAYSPSEVARFLDGLARVQAGDDDFERASADAFAKIVRLLKRQVKELQVLKFGPADASTGKLGESDGLYVLVVGGPNRSQELTGILLGSVET